MSTAHTTVRSSLGTDYHELWYLSSTITASVVLYWCNGYTLTMQDFGHLWLLRHIQNWEPCTYQIC